MALINVPLHRRCRRNHILSAITVHRRPLYDEKAVGLIGKEFLGAGIHKSN
jgi:hypothetical protein